MELRDYQQEAVSEIMKDLGAHKRALLSLATGLGKTQTAFEVMRRRGGGLFVTNKIDLAIQSLDRWKSLFGDEGAVLCVGSKGKRDISRFTFATVQTASKLELGFFPVVVIDETHVDLDSDTSWYNKLIRASEGAAVLGLTATPFRTNKGYIYGKGKFYPRVSYAKDIKWGVEHGFLVEPKLKAGREQFDTDKVSTRMGDFDLGELGLLARDEERVKKQVADALSRTQDRKYVAWSCVNIEHANMVADILRESGQTAISYHSQTEARSQEMERLRNLEYRNLVFVNAVSEGFDLPALDTLIMMRPTRSPGLAIQQIGRVLRPWGDKKDAWILDYGQVIRNIGPIDNPIIRTTSARMSKREKLEVEMTFKVCECLQYVPRAIRICPDCGHDFFKDAIKNVDDKPDHGVDLFSSKTHSRVRWMSVGDVDAVIKPSKNGNKMIQLRIKKTIFDGPFAGVLDHIVLEGWNRIKGQVKIAAYAGPLFQWSWDQPETCVRAVSNSDVVEVLVDETGKWPKILRVRKADGREIFVG